MRVVFHLGYLRSGSTYLQTNVFPKHKEINFLGPKNYYNWNDVKITQVELDRIASNYEEIDLINKDISLSKIDYTKLFDRDKLNVISSEKYYSYKNIINNFRDVEYFNALLEDKFKNVNIDFLIVIRNQYDLIKSLYFHAFPMISHFVGIKDFETLIKCFDKNLLDTYINFPFLLFARSYNFYSLYSNLSTKFKKSNIKFLFYEDLKFDKDTFINSFADFLNLDKLYTKEFFNKGIVNPLNIKKNTIFFNSSLRFKLSNNSFIQKIKNYIPRPIKNIILKSTLSKKYISLEENQIFEQKVKNYYKESNLKFFKVTKLKNKYSY